MHLMIRLFVGLIFLFSSTALPESGSVAYRSTVSLTQAMVERENKCNQLKQNPNCPEAQRLLVEVSGLSVANCRAQVKSLKCEDFFNRYPAYKTKAIRCEPGEICELGLESTLLKGCALYGIQVKDEFTKAIESETQCLGQWSCAVSQQWSVLEAAAAPTVFLQNQAAKAALSIVKSVRSDAHKFKKIGCLNPQTQAQFQCYLAVKYGQAVLGVAGAAKAAATGLVARMALVEGDLTAAEISGASKLAKTSRALKESTFGDHLVLETAPNVDKQQIIAALKKAGVSASNEERPVIDLPISTTKRKDSLHLDSGDTAAINSWAKEVLETAQAAHPGEKLEIRNVSVGAGFSASRGRIHIDNNSSSYLHATSTLPGGPSTVVFSDQAMARIEPMLEKYKTGIRKKTAIGDPELSSHILFINKDGSATVEIQWVRQVLGTVKIPASEFRQPAGGTTLILSGRQHVEINPEIKPLTHSSPPSSQTPDPWDRVTFFIVIKPVGFAD